MIVKQPEAKFPTAPEGTFPAVCVDEIDLGKVKTTFNGEERERVMVRLVWQIDEEIDDETAEKYKMPKGSHHVIKQDYTASLDEKAKLRKHLQSWRGRAFTASELFGFDLESIIGTGCMIAIVHASGRKGGTFANVESVMKLPKGFETPKSRGYIRVKDRKQPEPVPATHGRRYAAPEEMPPEFNQGITDDDVPF